MFLGPCCQVLTSAGRWNDEALADTFFLSLSEGIWDRLTPVDIPASFERLVELAIKGHKHLQVRVASTCK